MAISPRTFSRLALANFAALFLIIASGAAVRLTGSGLGCPDWPNCFRHQFTGSFGQVHSLIEDGNRAVTALLVVLAGVTFVASFLRTPRRADLAWLSGAIVGGIVGDAVLGGIVVYTKLNAWLVSGHMALSLGLLLVAAVLHHRSKYQYGPGARREVRCAWTVPLARWLWVPLTGTLLLGMTTTGSGPHSGGSQGQLVAKRLPFALYKVAWLHSVFALTLIGIVAGAFLVLHQTNAPARVVGGAKRLLVIGSAQGLIGAVQYITHLPVLLVELHVIGAASVTIGVLHFQLSQVARDREPGLEKAPPQVTTEAPLVAL